jgi:hypothetical protein
MVAQSQRPFTSGERHAIAPLLRSMATSIEYGGPMSGMPSGSVADAPSPGKRSEYSTSTSGLVPLFLPTRFTPIACDARTNR